jgi:hypothetical protein
MVMDIVVTVLGAAVTGVFAWAFNINSEVNVQKKAVDDLKELINSRFDGLEKLQESNVDNVNDKFDSQSRRLDRIERSMNGHLLRE